MKQWAGVFAIYEDREKAEEMAKALREAFRVYRIYVVDLGREERLKAIDLDPDLADIRKGYAIVIEAEGT